MEELEDNKVKLHVEVDESEMAAAVADAFVKIGREVRIPGFRPGKAPRKVLEARLGKDVARGQALQDAIPDYYGRALIEHDVDAVAQPELDITSGEEDGPVAFDAVVQVRPVVAVSGYEELEVEMLSPVATDEEIDEQIDRIRDQYADLVEVDRPAADGDHVLMNIAGFVEDEAEPGLTAEDYSYEVGQESLVVELDENLRGASAGDELEFGADHPQDPDSTIDFQVKVLAVREKVLPELTDEWAAEATEHETVEELRSATAERIETSRRGVLSRQLRDRVARAVGELVDHELPEALVTGTMNENMQNLAMMVQAQGLTLEQWMAFSGQDPERFGDDLREAAENDVRADLALRAVALEQDLGATEDEIEHEIEHTASHLDEDAAGLRERLERFDGLLGVRSEIAKRKALDWLIERVRIVDSEGEEIDRTLLSPPEEQSTGHADEDAAEETTE